MRRNLQHINRSLRTFSYRVGQSVTWYEFDTDTLDDDGDDDDLFDEGVGSTPTWQPGIAVPCIQAYYLPAAQGDTAEGLYLVDNLRLTISVDQFERKTHIATLDEQHRLNDRIAYEDRTYSVDSWRLMGRVADQYTIISVAATEVKADEGLYDLAGEPGV